MVGYLIGQGRALIGEELLVLGDTLLLQRCHNLGYEAWQLSLRLNGVLATYDMIANEGGVVTDKHPASEGDADGKRLVMRVSQSDNVAVVPIWALQGHDAEVA